MNLSDEIRYSRQSYTIGKDVMLKISNAKILVIGNSELSLEVLKNLVLTGINSIDINLKKCIKENISNLYFSNKDLLFNLRKLNPTINIDVIEEISDEFIKNYNLVILIDNILEEGIKLNNLCRQSNVPFIYTFYQGLYGFIFNDFGNKYVIEDVDGESYENLIIEEYKEKKIKFKDVHNLSFGDILVFKKDSNTKEYLLKETIDVVTIELKEELDEIYLLEGVSLYKKKISQEISYKNLEINLQKPEYTMAELNEEYYIKTKYLHELNQAYNDYLNKFKENPKPWNTLDFEKFSQLIPSFDEKDDKFKTFSKKFCMTLRGNLLPISSIIGGIVSQEVVKCIGRKYIPINQFLYLDFIDIISDEEILDKEVLDKEVLEENKYSGYINIFREEIFKKIQNTRTFIVGSGAIGCELIKNLGMIGNKNIIITDMDNIEKSNLSRQFLFSDEDIHKSKSQTAAKKIKLLNPDCEIKVYENKVCKETENIFNKQFYQNIDIILNALDNVDARVYVDKQTIKYEKPLIDSGTMGTKGSLSVILPYLTETYGNPDKDDKKAIPICTIKSFPYKPEHTIQWGRELFESEFNQIPSLINRLMRNPEQIKSLNDSDSRTFLRQIYKYRNFGKTDNFYEEILEEIFYENYVNSIKELCEKYKDDTSKKLPSFLEIKNIDIIKKVNNFMRLGTEIFNQIFKRDVIRDNKVVFEMKEINYEKICSRKIDEIKNDLENIIMNMHEKICELEIINFDKDNDNLHHVDFITCTSNLRNLQYNIDETDIYETRKIAGNIIPALITTTSIIAGYQIIEYFRIIKYFNNSKENKLSMYKNRYINTSMNYYDAIEVSGPKIENVGIKKISIWDRINVNHTYNKNELIDLIEKIFNNEEKIVKVTYISENDNLIKSDTDDLILLNYTEDLKILLTIKGEDEYGLDDKDFEIPVYLKNI